VQQGLTAIIRRLREVMSALHPTVLQYAGLEAALHAVADQQAGLGGFEADVAVEAAATGVRDELLLSVARELLGNAARHARASRVEVSVRAEEDELVLTVADDGAGMAPGRVEQALARGAIGLAISRERVEAVGGELSVTSAPAPGTRVRARVPRGRAPDRKAGISSLEVRQDRE
jgi:two-component system NarL family sensor kinase